MSSSRFQCHICDFACGRVKSFEDHMTSAHGFSSLAHAYTSAFLGGVFPECACNSCHQVPTFRGWNQGFVRYVDGHSGKIYSALGESRAKEVSEQRAEKLRGRTGWSEGLTKDSDLRVKRAAETRSKTVKRQFSTGERRAWSVGKTKQSDPRVQRMSDSLVSGFRSGELRVWSAGLTKDTDTRVFQMSISVSRSHRKKELRNRLDMLKRLDVDIIRQRLEANTENLELISDLSDYQRDHEINLEFRCKQCGHSQFKSLIQALSDRCDFCTPMGSKGQNELLNFINEINFRAVPNDRTIISPLEIDIALHDQKLGIEYNGLYFHSELFKDKKYHDEKSEMAAEVGWRLIHIFEDDWRDKREIVMSMIRHRYGISPRSIGARCCTIKEVTSEERKAFFERCHVDGDVRASRAWGLFYEDALVACVSIRRPMHKKYSNSIELARFATELNTSIVGGLSRLCKAVFKYCKSQGISRVMTYIDTRVGAWDVTGYEKCGFKLIGKTPPRFWWTDGVQRIDRFKIRADRSEGLTEKQVADQHGVIKIWGCRNLLLEYSIC